MRPKLTYANVLATLALVIAAGGASAFAATQLAKNSVGTKQLKKNAVTGAKVKDHSLTGHDVVASTLGTVPTAGSAGTAGHADTAGTATTLQGLGPSAFVHGDATVVGGRRDLDIGVEAPLMDIPGLLHVTAECSAGPKVTIAYSNATGQPIDGWRSVYGVPPAFFELASEGTSKTIATIGSVEELELVSRASPPEVANIRLMLNVNSPQPCMAVAEATTATGAG